VPDSTFVIAHDAELTYGAMAAFAVGGRAAGFSAALSGRRWPGPEMSMRLLKEEAEQWRSVGN
jgi:hypothetical protein